MMHVDVVWLTAALLSCPLLTLGDPLYIMSAPQILKVGTPGRVFVEVQDYRGTDTLTVDIRVMNFPNKNRELAQVKAALKPDNGYQALVDIEIPFTEAVFKVDSEKQQFVYLKSSWSNGKQLEKRVMVSFQSGHIYVFTDKTIYTPDSDMRYRLFVLNPDVLPTSKFVSVDIVNPEGMVVETKRLAVHAGVASGRYKLLHSIKNGIWKIAAAFTDNPKEKFTAEFEVKEYRLPSFDISLNPVQSYYCTDEEEFKVSIGARYLWGTKVEGSAFVLFGVHDNRKKFGIRSSLKRVPIRGGQGEAVLLRKNIIETFPNIQDLVGKNLYMSISVLTDSGNEMVEAERREIQIVTSPYIISFTQTTKFFKPGLPFNFKAYVTNPDGTPAEMVTMLAQSNNKILTGITDNNGVAEFIINTDENTSELSITVKTNVQKLKPERQAEKTVKAQPYRSNSKSFLNIHMPYGEKMVGSQERFELHMKNEYSTDHEVTYMVLSKGKIMKASKLKMFGALFFFAVSLEITKDMLPSFQLVAYYHVGNSEVVSDSIWVDVEDTCIGKLKIGTTGIHKVYEPGDPVDLKLTGDPGAKVYLAAVDKSAYVLNKNRLTQKKIWDAIESHYTGCTAGGGKDSMGVFYDAGLMFATDSAGSTAVKEDEVSHCQLDPKRQRRANTAMVIDMWADEAEDINEVSDEITSRSVFPDSWMFDTVELPVNYNKHQWESVSMKNYFIPDYITTWVISAVSLSKDRGICVADPFEVTVKKNFFIDLKLPYSAVVNEQIEIKAIIHNQDNREYKTVYVELLETEHICSKASNKKQKFSTAVKIDPGSSYAVSFVIVPLKPGTFDIEVKAFSLQPLMFDGVKKKLKVETWTQYYARYDQKTPNNNNFELEVNLTKDKPVSTGETIGTYTLTILTRFLKARDATLTILDIVLPMGLFPDTSDLEKLRSDNKFIEKLEMNKPGGLITIYLKKVSHTQTERIVFRLHGTHGDFTQPASVTVYESNSPDSRKSVKFYDRQLKQENGLLSVVCLNDVCHCAETTCPKQMKYIENERSLDQAACDGLKYVYKVNLKQVNVNSSTVIYTFNIEEFLKFDSDDDNSNKEIHFLTHTRCQEQLDIKKGKSYLIMVNVQYIENKSERHIYLLDDEVWLVYWPTQAESQSDKEMMNLYITLKSFSLNIKSGCKT